MLQGYRLWGFRSDFTRHFQVTIRLYRGSSLVAERTLLHVAGLTNRTFEVRFSQGVSIRAGVLHTATAKVVAFQYFQFYKYDMASVSCSGVTVTFKRSSKVNTNAYTRSDQIPALIFRSPQC